MSEAMMLAVDATRALEPADSDAAWVMAERLAKSGLLGRDKAQPAAVFAVLVAGRELGLTAMASLRTIHVIEGKTVLSADLIVALVRRSPDCEYLRLVDWTAERCTLEGKRRGDPAIKLTWTMDDAKAAGLLGKDNWKKYARAMLRSRASTELCRALWPEIAMGLYDPDEVGAPVHVEAEVVSRSAVGVGPATAITPPVATQSCPPTADPGIMAEVVASAPASVVAIDRTNHASGAWLDALKQRVVDARTPQERRAVRAALVEAKTSHPGAYEELKALYARLNGVHERAEVAS